MTSYFPKASAAVERDGIRTRTFRFGRYDLLVSEIQPGARLQRHGHAEGQFGLCIAGSFEFEFEDEAGSARIHQLDALGAGYWLAPHTPHCAVNRRNEVAVGVDVKHLLNADEHVPLRQASGSFIEPSTEKEWKTGLVHTFFVGPWFELMLTRIPSGGVMPAHAHYQEQIGVALQGAYLMEVGEERQQEFSFGKIYFAPPNVSHAARNDSEQDARSLNIFVPPRYNRKSASAARASV